MVSNQLREGAPMLLPSGCEVWLVICHCPGWSALRVASTSPVDRTWRPTTAIAVRSSTTKGSHCPPTGRFSRTVRVAPTLTQAEYSPGLDPATVRSTWAALQSVVSVTGPDGAGGNDEGLTTVGVARASVVVGRSSSLAPLAGGCPELAPQALSRSGKAMTDPITMTV